MCETGRSAVHKFVYPFSRPLNGSASVVVSTMITVAGIRGFSGFSGDLGPATSANLYFPSSVVVIPASISVIGGNGVGTNLFICDWYNNRIRLVTGLITAQGSSFGSGSGTGIGAGMSNGVTGTITTVAGGGSINSGNGDGGPGELGNILITYSVKYIPHFSITPYNVAHEYFPQRHQRFSWDLMPLHSTTPVAAVNTLISTSSQHCFNASSQHPLVHPSHLFLSGTLLYISEFGAHTVRAVSLSTGIITTGDTHDTSYQSTKRCNPY